MSLKELTRSPDWKNALSLFFTHAVLANVKMHSPWADLKIKWKV